MRGASPNAQITEKKQGRSRLHVRILIFSAVKTQTNDAAKLIGAALFQDSPLLKTGKPICLSKPYFLL
jgi:hypothetical protein